VQARAPRPQSFPALRHAGYRVYLVTSAVAMMADNIEHVITYWVMHQKFQSQTVAGFAVISHWLPFLLFSTRTIRSRSGCSSPSASSSFRSTRWR
jgi:hypothetical protein